MYGEARRTASSSSTDDALIVSAQAGDSDAMQELLVRYRSSLYRAARRFTSTSEDADDIVQEAMLRAFTNISRFRRESQIGTWLIAIVNNSALSLKRRTRHAHLESLDSYWDTSDGARSWDIPDVRRNPEDEVNRKELAEILHRVLSQQPTQFQAVVKACVFDEAPISEAAKVLGVSVASAKSRLFRARHRIRESFQRRGILQKASSSINRTALGSSRSR